MTKRRSISPARRKRILDAHDNKCAQEDETCDGSLELDHDHALGLGGTDDDLAFIPRCRHHHKIKTTGKRGTSKNSSRGNGDVQRIAKVKRLEKKHAEDAGHSGKDLSRSVGNSRLDNCSGRIGSHRFSGSDLKRPIKSRGFTQWRKFNGEIVER